MTTKEFVEKLDKDTELFNKAKTLKSRDEMYKLAKANGLTVDIDTFAKEFKACMEPYRNMNAKDVEVAAAGNLYDHIPKYKATDWWIIE